MTFEIGDAVSPVDRSGVYGDLFPAPLWFVIECVAMKEERAQGFLARHEVESWFPVEWVWRRKGRSRSRVQIARKVVPGYLFCLFPGAPYWDRLFDQYPGREYMRRVVGFGGRPGCITDEAMAQMELLPERLQAQRAVEAEKRRIRPGDRARVTLGAYEGRLVDVSEVSKASAKIFTPLFGGVSASIPLESLERVIGGSPYYADA